MSVDDEGPDGDIETQCDSNPAIWGSRIGGDLPGPVLAIFDGLDLAGDWTLTISDNAEQDLGSLLSWCLEVNSEVVAGPEIFSDGFDLGNTDTWTTP